MKKLLLVVLLLFVSGCGNNFFPDGRQPDAFIFLTKKDVPLATEIESDAVLIAGNIYGSSVAVQNGEWAVADDKGDFTTWTDLPGTVTAGKLLKVRHTSSSQFATSMVTTLRVQDYVATFTSITKNAPSAGSVSDSTGLITASDLVQAATPSNTDQINSLAASVTNNDIKAHSVTVTVQGKALNGDVLDTSTLTGTVQSGSTRILTSLKAIPSATYANIKNWIISLVKIN